MSPIPRSGNARTLYEMTDNGSVSVIPAQLGFLTIYNPSLGTTDETLKDQVVYYYSSQTSRSQSGNVSSNNLSPEEPNKDDTNERLRKIGLAQGMVNFAKNFSNGSPVDSVETEKSRIVLYELEHDWWILASIDLTRILPPHTSTNSTEASTSTIEYSSREVYPPHSLIQQLRRAHSIFLLHHGESLDNIYQRVGRVSLCKFLARYWNRFIRHWLVLLNGNPAADLFNGVKLAVGGELGIGVGEEEWGSGEREVLEGFVSRTDGLVDLIVSRFGDAPPVKGTDKRHVPSSDSGTWLGSDRSPRPSDGVVFSGVGAISRRSLASISHWMEWIYRHGEAAYGVDENPSSSRSRKPRRARSNPPPTQETATSRPHGAKKGDAKPKAESGRTSPGIPPPLVVGTPPTENQTPEENGISSETVMKYLTLGYGSAWKFPGISVGTPDEAAVSTKDGSGNEASQDNPKKTEGDEAIGKFIIGLRDDLEEDFSDEDNPNESIFFTSHQAEVKNRRTLLRTLQVETGESALFSNMGEEPHKKLQVLVYVHQPFMFTFLFDLRTPSLTLPSFYRSIHHQLGPLQKPLLSSTSPLNVSRRIYLADIDAGNQKRASSAAHNPIYDLVWDPSNLSVRSSIPNIPEPGSVNPMNTMSLPTSAPPSEPQTQWSRIEALNVHNQFLSTYTETRSRPLELERTCKTSRGWWLIWIRIQDSPSSQSQHRSLATTITDYQPEQKQYIESSKEAFLIRKASDASSHTGTSRHTRDSSSGVRFLRDLSGASSSLPNATGDNTSPGKLTEGLGFDTHEYIESLLSLNR